MSKFTFIFFCVFSVNSFGASIYFAKIGKIDEHNVIFLAKDGQLQAVSLGYLSTPVKGESLYAETSKYLQDNLLDKWVRVTELSYGKTALVKPALIRTPDMKLINLELIKIGLGVPNINTNPPEPLIEAAVLARNHKIGLWKDIDSFAKERANTSKSVLSKYLDDISTSAIENQRKNSVQPLVGDVDTNVAYKFECIMLVKHKRLFITKYAAKNNGFSLNLRTCPKG
jgi:hypothetical protein